MNWRTKQFFASADDILKLTSSSVFDGYVAYKFGLQDEHERPPRSHIVSSTVTGIAHKTDYVFQAKFAFKKADEEPKSELVHGQNGLKYRHLDFLRDPEIISLSFGGEIKDEYKLVCGEFSVLRSYYKKQDLFQRLLYFFKSQRYTSISGILVSPKAVDLASKGHRLITHYLQPPSYDLAV